MENLVEITYAQTGQSSATNQLGMREMQAMVYEQRHRQHLLVKAPPASGKSRAMEKNRTKRRQAIAKSAVINTWFTANMF